MVEAAIGKGTVVPEVVGKASTDRFLALIFDHSIALALTVMGVALVPAEYPAVKWIIFAGTYVTYFLVFEALWSRTPGKRLFGLVIRKLDGSPCGWKSASIRFALRVIEINPLLCGALPAAIAILTSKRRQRLGDMLAGTVVVSDKHRWELPPSDPPREAQESNSGTEQPGLVEISHIWLGQFGPEAPEDFFEEQYGREDDAPLSQFAASQGKSTYDHDHVEISYLNDMESVRSLVHGHSYYRSYLDDVVAKAAELGIQRANVFILAGQEQFPSPRSASGPGYQLWYLGEFHCATQ